MEKETVRTNRDRQKKQTDRKRGSETGKSIKKEKET